MRSLLRNEVPIMCLGKSFRVGSSKCKQLLDQLNAFKSAFTIAGVRYHVTMPLVQLKL